MTKQEKKAIKSLVDFNNFIRDGVVKPGQKVCLVLQLVMSNKKSSTASDDQKKKATNWFDALVNDSKSVFYATDRITKTVVRGARNSLYKKDIAFVNIYNGLENKKFLLEKVPLNAPFVEKKNYSNNII